MSKLVLTGKNMTAIYNPTTQLQLQLQDTRSNFNSSCKEAQAMRHPVPEGPLRYQKRAS